MAQRNPPLAGKPPFATSEPDSAFPQGEPQRRYRQNLSPADANSRSSAYDVYDNYLNDSNRNSGIGALGMGFMNADMDDDDDDDDDEIFMPAQKQKLSVATATATSAPASTAPVSVAVATLVSVPTASASVPAPANNAAPAAVAAVPPPPRSPKGTTGVPPSSTPSGLAPPVESHPQLHQAAIPLAAPRPGYAAPLAALNLARPSPMVSPAVRASPTNMTIQVPPPGIPIASIGTPVQSVPSTPHPLLPPITPITPAFARPPKSPVPRETVKFAKPEPIMRSDSEDVLLPKRGERGDDFWRRFSTIAKEENKKSPKMKESSWLKKNQSGSTRMSRWVWAAAIFILLCIAAGVAATLITTHGKSSPQQPTALGGSANETSSSIPSKSTATSRPSVRSHISPTHTVARRDVNSDAFPTVTSIRHRQIPDHPRYHRRRLGVALPE